MNDSGRRVCAGRRGPRATRTAIEFYQKVKSYMKIEDYQTPASPSDYAPRFKASQIYAAQHRAAPTEPIAPIATVRNPVLRSRLPLAVGALLLVAAMVTMITWQLSQPMVPLQIAPISATIPPTPAAATPAAPTPAAATPAAPTPAAPTPAPAAPAAGQTGRGLTSEDPTSTPVPAEPPAEPSGDYIANVGAQAAHSPRGGLCGPTSGDCAPAVPPALDNSQYIANVGAQAPHRVR